MGIGGIRDKQYADMTAIDCLDNLDGTSGAGGDHRYIRRDQFSKEQLVASTQNNTWGGAIGAALCIGPKRVGFA